MILLDEQLPKEPAEVVSLTEATELINKLEWELKHSATPGIGLAAPQIGINKAVAIIRVRNPYDLTNPIHSINLINPKIIEAEDFIQYNEGCLSFPGKAAKTVRYRNIILENTASDYEYYAEQINAKRYDRQPEDRSLLIDKTRRIMLGECNAEPAIALIEQLVCVCTQHEFSHLLGLTMFDFKPEEVGRNEPCPCGKDKKNKKCHNYNSYNKNLEKLLKPNYRGM